VSNSRRRSPLSLIALAALVASALPALALTAPADASAPAAASSLWTKSAQKPQASLNGHRRSVSPSSYKAYTLNKASMAGQLAQAPNEDSPAASRGGAVTVSIPGPTGELIDFAVVESPIMESELAAAHPEITTYAGNSVTEGYDATIRLDQGPLGFHASVIGGDKKSWYIDPAYIGDTSLYLSYWGDALPAPEKALTEPKLPQSTQRRIERDASQGIGEGANGIVIRREYRLALVSDPSYAVFYGNTDSLVLAGKTTMMNRINQIYNDDVAVKMLLVAGTDKLNFQTLTEATGTNGPCGGLACYSASDMTGCGNVIDKNTHVLAKLIGAENYDIGHIVFGEAGDGGGVAYLPSVGMDTVKGGGCTGLADPTGDAFAVDYVAHEMGHQFNGNHTFNGSSGSCGGNGEASAAVEPGSGTSIQAYAGICAQDNLQPHSDGYFSQKSQDEIRTHITGVTESYNEIQEFGFSQFAGTDGFTLNFGGPTTAAITNGTNYTAAGIKTAVEGAIGATVTASGVSANGFTLTYSGAKANTNIVNPTVTPTVAGSFTSASGDYVKGGASTNQGTAITTTNHNPTVTAPALGTKTIPNKTPFTLTGAGTDTDGNTLTYLWEQNDPGTGASTLGAHATGPLFRVFGKYANVTASNSLLYNSPGENVVTESPSRTFPDIEQIVANQTNAEAGCGTITETSSLPDNAKLRCHSEYLPDATYNLAGGGAMHFRLTARDQVATGGGTHFADVTVNVSPTIGPFLVTSPNTAVSYAGNSSQTVTWSNTTSSLSANVKISLSTDGGLTYPTVLLPSTPNDGTQSVTIPNSATTTARIKVEAVENYFFDISNTNFTITAAAGGLTVTQPVNPTPSVQYSDTLASVAFSATTDRPAAVLVASVDAGTPLPTGLSLSTNQGTDAAGNWVVSGTTFAPTGAYPVTIHVTDGTQTTDVPITITVTQENATPTYTGPTSASAPSAGTGVVSVPLTATIDQQADGTVGDLTTATATFVDATTSATLCTSAVTAGGAASCSFNADAPKTYAVKVNVGGRFTGTTASNTNLVVSAPAVVGVVVTPPGNPTQSVQYSDAIASVGFSATTDRPAGVLAASIGAGTPLPTGLTLSARSGTDSAASWTITGTADVAPGTYNVTVKITDGTQTVDLPLTFTVSAETATPTYTGPTTGATAAGAPTVDLALTATVAQAADGSLGDLSMATATFKDTTTSTTLCTSAVTTGGAANCTFTAAPGTYQVKVDVGGRFTGTTASDTTLTVSATPAGTVPNTTITSAPPKWLLGTAAKYGFASTVGGSTFACSLDAAASTACTSPKTVTGLSRATHVFTVAATAAGQTDLSPARAVTTVPVDDTVLKIKSGSWKRRTSSHSYLGTYTQTKKSKGAVLSYKVTNARSLALVIATGKNNGKVKVYLNGVFIKKVKFKGNGGSSKVVDLGTLLTPTSGELTIVAQNKKLVRIEGLGVATAV
jgi:hypothetical protein